MSLIDINEVTIKESKPVILIDAGYLIARSRYIFKDLSSHGTPTGAIYGFLSTIKQIRRNYPNYQIQVCLDSYSQWRKDLLPQYKADRESHQEEYLGSEKQMQHKFEKTSVRDIVCNIKNVKVLYAVDYEADDLIAIQSRDNPNSIIFSADKDMWQLTQYNIKITQKIQNGKFIFSQLPKEFENIPPQNLALYRAIMGDSSDGIPKLPRVLTKEVQEIAKQFSNPTDLLTSDVLTSKSFQIIQDNREQLLINYEICKLPPDREIAIIEHRSPKEGSLRLIEELELYSMRGLIQ